MPSFAHPNLFRFAILFAACVLILPGLSNIETLVFDETHYVPAARSLLSLTENRNPEHPLFAKEVIALGIWIFGDNAMGWRLPGALLSILGVLACFEIAFRVFRSPTLAALTALLILFNIMYVVQARTAMLDTITWPLFAMSVAGLLIATDLKSSKGLTAALLILSGILLGLATAAKWTAGIYAVFALIFLFGQRLQATLKARRPLLDVLFGRGFPTLSNLSFLVVGALFGVPSLLAYAATFIPAYHLEQDPLTSLFDLFTFHVHMIELQTMPLAENTYESDWWSWPLMLEPIWYEFLDTPDEKHRAILYLGNPVIYWGGLLALVACLVESLRRQIALPFRIAFVFLMSWLAFAIIPKQIGFLFYYHGSAIIMCFVVTACVSLVPKGKLRRGAYWSVLTASAIAYLYFLPVVYATKMPQHQWLNYIWLDSWS
ncbi:MAG: hypothetical protein CMK09_06970 [Ponticaulis sp.]|nr:hypothetical protein [Ponticaulis sp.]|tara:strand:+ start:64703 stop:65998 length:1296 start_codon:yes stop_codon:yes gene_type:complete